MKQTYKACPPSQSEYRKIENKQGASHTRKCIDGKITGCGNCVGYCKYAGHPGFLTREQRKNHDCIKKGCHYYVAKEKSPRERKEKTSERVLQIALKLSAKMEGLRITDAQEIADGSWELRYVTISNDYSVEALESGISAECGATVRLKALLCDYERAVKLIFRP